MSFKIHNTYVNFKGRVEPAIAKIIRLGNYFCFFFFFQFSKRWSSKGKLIENLTGHCVMTGGGFMKDKQMGNSLFGLRKARFFFITCH